jgi:hypothetical protein
VKFSYLRYRGASAKFLHDRDAAPIALHFADIAFRGDCLSGTPSSWPPGRLCRLAPLVPHFVTERDRLSVLGVPADRFVA